MKQLRTNISVVVWDWNGTLLDDLDACIESINSMLSDRSLPILTRELYRSIFGFPVKEYYEQAGFDFSKESFDTMAVEFIDLYKKKLPDSPLFFKVPEVLQKVKNMGLIQVVLSAMEQELLESSLLQKGIRSFFAAVYGNSNHFAHGKEHASELLSKQIPFSPDEIILIGDTIHDHEIALSKGWNCILVSNGHQARNRLAQTGRLVAGSLDEIPEMLT